MTIRRFRLLAFLGFLLLIAASVAVTFAALSEQRHDALVVNLAGRQRMLIQKMTLEVLGVQIGVNRVYRDDLHSTAHLYFEPTLKALIAGGPAPYTGDVSVTLPPPRNREILAQLEAVRADWDEMHAAIHRVLESEPGSPAFVEAVGAVERLSPPLLAQMDEATRLYEAEAERKVARVQAIQLGFLATAAALLVAVLFLTDRWLLTPLARLGAAARQIGEGDLRTPVAAAGLGEVDRLAHGFDDMRQRLAAAREELEQWAAELDGRVAARTREIAALGAIAQAANRHVEIGPLLAEVLPLLTEITRASTAWVTLLVEGPSPENRLGKFVFAGGHNLPPALEADERAAMRWPGCACQRKLLAGELTAAMNILECERLQRTRGLLPPAGDTAGLRYHASVPIRGGGRALGILNLATPTQPLFGDDELRLLTAIGGLIGVAVERARLHEQVKAHHIEEQAALLRFSQALLGETEAQAVMDVAARTTAEALDVEFVALALIDAGGASVSARASLGWPPELLPRLQRVPPEFTPALAHAIRTHAPVVIPDEARETRFAIPPWVAQMGIVSSLLAPMLAAGKAIGGLVVNSRTARDWSDDDARLLALIANDTAQALERAHLFAETQRQARQQTALFHLSASLAATLDEEEIYQRVTHGLHEILGYFQVALFLVDENTGHRRLRAIAGWKKTPLKKPIPPGKGLSERPLLDGQLHYTPDVRTDPRYDPGPGQGAEVDVPLKVGGEIVGVLVVESERPHAFDENDFTALTTAANLAGQALERARLYAHAQERLERITALHDIDVAIASHLGLHERLDVLLEKVTERLRVDAAAVAFIDSETRELVYAAKRGLDGEFFVDGLLKVKEGIAGQVAHTGEVAAIPDVRAEPRFMRAAIAERLGLVSYLAVPLRARGEIIGVLEMATRARHTFPPEEIDFFVTLAGQAAIAIDNARMFEAARQRAAQQHTLAERAGAILATLDMEALWPAVMAAARQTLSADRAAVYLYDAAADRLTCPHASGLSAEYVAEINRRFREVPGSRVLSDPRPIAIADAQTDPAAAPVRDLVVREGFRSYAVFPLTAPGAPLGALVAYRDAVAPFTPDDIVTGQTLAHIVAVAQQNARLFQTEREQRELAEALRDALGAGAALSATLDFDTVLDHMLEQIARVVPYDTANVMLLDAPTGRIRVARQRGYEQFGEPTVRDIAALSLDIAATANLRRMAETGRPLVIPDTAAYPGWVKVEATAYVRSWAGAPIVVEGQVIAFFSLDKIEPNFYQPEHGERLVAFAGQAALALQNARLFEATGRRAQELALLYDAGLTLNRTLDPRQQLEFLLKLAQTALRADAAEFFVFDSTRNELRYEFGIGLSAETADTRRERSLHFAAGDENTVAGWVATNRMLLNLPDAPADPRWVATDPAILSALFVPVAHEEQLRGILSVKSKSGDAFTPQDERLITLFANQVSVAMNNARLLEETRRRAGELEAMTQVATALRQAQTHEAMLPLLVETTMQLLRADAGTILLLEGERLAFVAARGPGEAMLGLRHPVGDDPLWQVARTGAPMFISDVAERGEFNRWEVCRTLMLGLRACACVPLKTAEATIGLLHLAFRSKWVATEGEIRLLTSIAEIASNALHRATLHEQTTQRLQRLASLRAIDIAISASLDLRLTLNVFLDQVTTQLRLDAADVLLLNPRTQTLEYTAGRGFRGSAITRTRARLGEGHAGRAALEQRIVHVSNLRGTRPAGLRTRELTGEEAFVTYYAVPLIAKGKVKGVLEIFHRTFLNPDPEWLDFLEALAVQAGIAIDNAALFDDLQRSNVELALAYDTTIEGWSKALDLRDKETEGHTLRVTEMALHLARALGLKESDLLHFRRGALLHDIGKMGVPDAILLKPGPLTDDEWGLMRQHPLCAYDMLLPIAYLRPALDIPYCHHEKWDGTGYPRGLKGEDIPLAARIFAVADVWDALTSDRPYRAAWPKEKALEYIRQQAGRHFDPKVVDVFLRIVSA